MTGGGKSGRRPIGYYWLAASVARKGRRTQGDTFDRKMGDGGVIWPEEEGKKGARWRDDGEKIRRSRHDYIGGAGPLVAGV